MEDRRSRGLALIVAAVVAAWTGVVSAAPRDQGVETSRALSGRIRAAGTREPLGAARVLVVPAAADEPAGEARKPLAPDAMPAWTRAASTDSKGRFRIDALPQPRVRVIVLADGYVRGEWIVDATVPSKRPIDLFVEPDPEQAYRTVVTEEVRRPEQTATSGAVTLSRVELERVPGTQGDPLRALQSLPGAARPPGGLGLLILRGATPAIYIDEHPAPRAFHVLGLAGVIPPNVLDEIELEPGGYGAPYMGRTGGMLRLYTRDRAPPGVHGHAALDLLGASASLTTPIKRGDFVIGARRAWFDAALRGVEKVAGDLGTLFPSYGDWVAVYGHPVGKRGRIVTRVIGAVDRLRAGDEQGLDFSNGFHRFDLVYRASSSKTDVTFTPSLRFDHASLAAGPFTRRRRDVVVSTRAAIEHRFTPGLALLVGADTLVDAYDASQTSSVPEVDARYGGRGSYGSGGVWVVPRLGAGPFAFEPGLRVSGMAKGATGRAFVDPRWRVRLTGRRVRLQVDAGLYAAVSVLEERDSVNAVDATPLIGDAVGDIPPALVAQFDPGLDVVSDDDVLQTSRSFQGSVGLEVDVTRGITAAVTPFVRLVQTSPGTGLFGFSDGSYTRAAGLDALLRKRLTGRLYGWIGYSLLRVESRRLPSIDWNPTAFDQRHGFFVVLSGDLPRHWRIGARFRIATGTPYSPIIGAVEREDGWSVPIRDFDNPLRRPLFHQLDVRVDKEWILKRTIVGAYLEIVNFYDYRYPEVVLYTLDWRERVGSLGLPILPTVGVQVRY